MQNREAELTKIAPAFWADVATVILRYRGISGENVIDRFAEKIEYERDRLRRKLDSLKSNPDYAALVDQVAAVEHQINQIADGELARARASGVVEFDPLIGELARNRAAMEALVKQLDKGSN